MNFKAFFVCVLSAAFLGGACGDSSSVLSAQEEIVFRGPGFNGSAVLPSAAVSDDMSAVASQRKVEVSSAVQDRRLHFSFTGEEKATDLVEAPYRWDACSDIRFATNFSLASPQQVASFYSALEVVSSVTGLSFVDVGSFAGGHEGWDNMEGFQVSDGRSVGAIDAFFGVYTRYTDDVLDGKMALANVTWRRSDGDVRDWFVHGYAVMMDDPWWESDFELSRKVWLHEIGHLVGLGHVADSDEIMSRSPLESNSSFGEGDLAGLEKVGVSQGCRDVSVDGHVHGGHSHSH
ncbi:MAG: hypothetical protein P8N13_09535 [Ilumatobacter sp.]|nr:hypothetical protein [Ilumatobacter sp.]